MEIVTFVTPAAENPYAADIKTLSDAMIENPNAMGVFTVKNSDAIKAKKQIADAANAIGKTASFGKRTIVESTETRYSVMLTHKHAARRNKAREEASKATESNAAIIADTITEAAVAVELIKAAEAEAIKPMPKPSVKRVANAKTTPPLKA